MPEALLVLQYHVPIKKRCPEEYEVHMLGRISLPEMKGNSNAVIVTQRD